MKKTILSIVSLLVVGAIGLSSCIEIEDDNDDGAIDDGSGVDENADFTVSISNLATFYLPTDTIPWEDVALTLTFKDTSINSVTLTKGVFDVTELGEDDEFILYTSGLYALSTVAGDEIPEGDYSISYYLEYEGEAYSGTLMSIRITAYPEDIYSVFQFNEPEICVEYRQNLERVNSEEGALESEFYAAPTYYEIGDDNPFIYKPELILWDGTYQSSEEGVVMGLETPDTYSVTASVTHIVSEDEEEEVDLLSNEYVSYSNFGFDFTEKAIGEVFTIAITLNNFTTTISGQPLSYSLTVKVEDGYNINAYYTAYDPAIDLGRMSLVDEEKLTEEGLSVSDFEYGESYYNIFYQIDEETSEPEYVHKEYPTIWADFYEEKGITDAEAVNGLYIHGDITITKDDLPSDFLISAEEAVTVGGQGFDYTDMVDSIRDGVIIYNHLMDTEDFTLNGNLFQIDASGLKWNLTRVKTGSADRNGDISGTALEFYAEESAEWSVTEGTATLFAFDGYKMERENTNYGIILEPKATAYVVNLETNGNMEGNGNTYTDEKAISWLSSGTLTFCKSVCAQTVVENVITKHFLTAYYAEKTTMDWTCFDVNHAKIYDCYGVAFVIWVSGNNVVNNSEIKRFGGPVALMFCAEDEEGFFKGYNYAGFTIGENVTTEAALAGDEAWFNIYGLSTYLSYFTAFDSFFSGGDGLENLFSDLLGNLGSYVTGMFPCTDYGKTMLDEDGKFSLLSFGMERHTTGTDLYIDFGFGTNTGDNSARVNADCDTSDIATTDYEKFEYISTLFYGNEELCNLTAKVMLGPITLFSLSMPLPIFITNTGKIFAPSFTGDLTNGFTETLIDIGDYYSQVACGVESPTTKEISLDSDDTSAFMYYPLDLTSLGDSTKITFAMAFTLYDKPASEEDV